MSQKQKKILTVKLKRALALLPLICCALFVACSNGPEANRPNNPIGLSKKYPKDVEVNFALAKALWGKSDVCSDPPLAIQYLDKVVSLAPDYADAYQRRGLAKSDLYDWDGAFDDLTMAVRLNPVAENYAYRGLVSLRGGNAMGARLDFDKSVNLNSDQHRAWNFRAALNLLHYDYPAACADFKKGCSNGDCTGLDSAKKYGYCE